MSPQRCASDGSAVGSEFQVKTYTTSQQWEPVVATDTDGDFVAAFSSEATNENFTLFIQARQYLVSVFAHGVESGDTAAWSNSVP